MRTFSAVLTAVAVVTTGCGGASTGPPVSAPTHTAHPVRISFHVQHELAAADSAFAEALWAKLATRDGNVVLSPASIATALQMAYVGARGDTAAEMARTLHLGSDATTADLAAAAGGLLNQVDAGSSKDSLLQLADAVWVQRNYPVAPGFRAAMADDFGSVFHLADFAEHGEEARKAINAAIAGLTHDRIHDLLPPGADLTDTRLLLANTIYLKAAWESAFETGLTAPAPFTRSDGKVVRPKTMNATETFDYAATDDYQAVRLPYKGHRLAMTLLLPAHGRPLTWPAGLKFTAQTVDLALPKFTFSWDAELTGLLIELGMSTAFTDVADFSGISSESLHIGTVQHKAFIAVDENGTEAAAATAVGIVAGAAPAPTSMARLHFDRPFLFRIDDTVTGLPLFLGKVEDPTLGA